MCFMCVVFPPFDVNLVLTFFHAGLNVLLVFIPISVCHFPREWVLRLMDIVVGAPFCPKEFR